ncbi:hypothetical protein LOH54_10900 [Sulfurimonas sp. HSL-3221]|uniref:hypothetical protein n=1 Tax=Sulfurimonadaceae TaxID=2771471 RepID=UPI001E486344|nr:hypothetical protein [Sulfurimonas sp. HSL-3221]UFS62153.1 hypothetical protein LOH54_10900 [Sulfurimonas sp. HSL-3221]
MNKINIVYVFGAALFLALLMFVQSSRTEHAVQNALKENAETARLGKQIRTAQQQWDDSKQLQRRIDAILMQGEFKSFVDRKNKNGRTYQVQFTPLPAQTFDRLTTKLFNTPVTISKMTVSRGSDQNVSLSVEFAL